MPKVCLSPIKYCLRTNLGKLTEWQKTYKKISFKFPASSHVIGYIVFSTMYKPFEQ